MKISVLMMQIHVEIEHINDNLSLDHSSALFSYRRYESRPLKS